MAPTALWISKKEQHLLAGTAATYPCFSVGAYPQNRFIWYLNDTKIHQTPLGGDENKVGNQYQVVNNIVVIIKVFSFDGTSDIFKI